VGAMDVPAGGTGYLRSPLHPLRQIGLIFRGDVGSPALTCGNVFVPLVGTMSPG
jgi:hypothetical protein